MAFFQKKHLKWLIVLTVIIVLAVVYKNFNPAVNAYFPKCPSKLITGLDCPGCGSQRAIHQLLNFDLKGALKMNALLVVSIPYLITGFVFDNIPKNEKVLKWRKRLFGEKAIYIILFIIVAYTVLRNIFR